jgi:choline dehydrogenase
MDTFDYIIIGAGTAGCVLADRLSADGKSKVLVLEAGGSDNKFWIKTPIGYGRTFADATVNWKYQAQPSPGLNGRGMYWPRGRVVGGSSSINALAYCRGMPADFEDWRAMGQCGLGLAGRAALLRKNRAPRGSHRPRHHRRCPRRQGRDAFLASHALQRG